MKTFKNLYTRITSFENLLLAARKAERGKRFKASTAIFNMNLERELLRLQRVKEKLRLPYIRYMDDWVAFDNSKSRLHEIKARMETYLFSLRLTLHENKCRVHRVKDGVTFLGYRIFPTHRLLPKKSTLRARRRLKKLGRQYGSGKIPLATVNQSVQGWIGHASHADTWRLRSRILGSVVFRRGGAGTASGRFLEQQSGKCPVRCPQQQPEQS